MKITILGCGASAGVPLIGCKCPVCLSDNPKNKRTRSSIAIESDAGQTLLVDMSPDLRQQALANMLTHVHAVFVTHAHADHCHGIDDMRSFNYCAQSVLPLYSDAQTLEELQQRFSYVFQEPSPYGWIRAALKGQQTEHGRAFDAAGMQVTPFLQHHGKSPSYGIRIGKAAYSTDVKSFPHSSQGYLYDLDVWIVDCLSIEEKPTHAHLDLTLEWIAHYKPKRAILTHLGHDFDYETLRQKLPANVEPAYDGMVLDV